MAAELKANGIILPSPVQIKSGHEIIWSSNTGRNAKGDTIGDVIAKKKTIDITWGILTESQLRTIDDNLIAGFFPFIFYDKGIYLPVIAYRGTLSEEHMGYIGDGIYYYRSASVNVVQK